jgi:hypothetical protein
MGAEGPLLDTSNAPARAMEEQSAHLSPHAARSVGKIGAETYSAASFKEALSCGEERVDPYVCFAAVCARRLIAAINHPVTFAFRLSAYGVSSLQSTMHTQSRLLFGCLRTASHRCNLPPSHSGMIKM